MSEAERVALEVCDFLISECELLVGPVERPKDGAEPRYMGSCARDFVEANVDQWKAAVASALWWAADRNDTVKSALEGAFEGAHGGNALWRKLMLVLGQWEEYRKVTDEGETRTESEQLAAALCEARAILGDKAEPMSVAEVWNRHYNVALSVEHFARFPHAAATFSLAMDQLVLNGVQVVPSKGVTLLTPQSSTVLQYSEWYWCAKAICGQFGVDDMNSLIESSRRNEALINLFTAAKAYRALGSMANVLNALKALGQRLACFNLETLLKCVKVARQGIMTLTYKRPFSAFVMRVKEVIQRQGRNYTAPDLDDLYKLIQNIPREDQVLKQLTGKQAESEWENFCGTATDEMRRMCLVSRLAVYDPARVVRVFVRSQERFTGVEWNDGTTTQCCSLADTHTAA